MIRFRCSEDEQRYLRLLAQIHRQCARHLPPGAMEVFFRNITKMQDMLMLEGVRQGFAAAELGLLIDAAGAQDSPVRHLKAFQAHATVYGSSDTPLQAVETEWVEHLGGADAEPALKAWLDKKPMRFAPDVAEESDETVRPFEPAPGMKPISHQELAGRGAFTFESEEEIASVQMPAFIDQTRDQIQALQAGGWQPESWSQLILDLHRRCGVDAGMLDMQLATPMGEALLAQCGIYIQPDMWTSLTDLSADDATDEAEASSRSPSSPPPPPAPPPGQEAADS